MRSTFYIQDDLFKSAGVRYYAVKEDEYSASELVQVALDLLANVATDEQLRRAHGRRADAGVVPGLRRRPSMAEEIREGMR